MNKKPTLTKDEVVNIMKYDLHLFDSHIEKTLKIVPLPVLIKALLDTKRWKPWDRQYFKESIKNHLYRAKMRKVSEESNTYYNQKSLPIPSERYQAILKDIKRTSIFLNSVK